MRNKPTQVSHAWREQWVVQFSLSAAALKCGVRDRGIGWDFRSQYGRLKLIANKQSLPERVLAVNRGHWAIESVHHIIDWKTDAIIIDLATCEQPIHKIARETGVML